MNVYLASSLTLLVTMIFGYLIGSFPSAIFIGKVFYGVDVRKQGSHNAGGTNVGRVIGKKAGIITIALDVLKTVIAIWVPFLILTLSPLKEHLVSNEKWPLAIYYYMGGVAAAIGHSFPIFAHFKGGKAMSVFSGFVFATNPVISILGVIIFFLIFLWKKYVSLASILAPFSVVIMSIFLAIFPVLRCTNYFFVSSCRLDGTYIYTIFLLVIALYVVLRHIPNIKRLMKGTEPKTHFKKTPKASLHHENKEVEE
ncbi:MAG TPA: acyl-phosphate glycerol 3-phosphate acyltransferase [Firmicutes bacterium]|nr:acyl-phosphate glycerol 3-phosphate acyltransferase [Bacillota bacterium]